MTSNYVSRNKFYGNPTFATHTPYVITFGFDYSNCHCKFNCIGNKKLKIYFHETCVIIPWYTITSPLNKSCLFRFKGLINANENTLNLIMLTDPNGDTP